VKYLASTDVCRDGTFGIAFDDNVLGVQHRDTLRNLRNTDECVLVSAISNTVQVPIYLRSKLNPIRLDTVVFQKGTVETIEVPRWDGRHIQRSYCCDSQGCC
jgi:hypothetical protein